MPGTTRQASSVTLRCRAFAKAERLRERVADAQATERSRRDRYDKREQTLADIEHERRELNDGRINAIRDKFNAAATTYAELSGTIINYKPIGGSDATATDTD